LILASSAQADLDNPYGRSKRAAEKLVSDLAETLKLPTVIFRLPGVFGKWCRPNYNSVVATFCHNIARNQPIEIHDPNSKLQLVYVDDVVTALIAAIDTEHEGVTLGKARPEYTISLAELAVQIRAFRACRTSLETERVGKGLIRALYATYVSYLPVESVVYPVPKHADERGVFVEMLKTPDAGQFSYFTAYPGVTRGEHYHHTKSEKFLVIKGRALFRFRHLLTNQRFEIETSGEKPQIVDTMPGWSHDITNIGDEEMVVMLWANENFDRDRPDTIRSKV
jgi:UDP-2-acetamido-2,6-beta-L-arabino-hexul-4-ose reductase